MSVKSMSIGVAARALAAGFIVAGGALAFSSPASAALSTAQKINLVDAIVRAAQDTATTDSAAGKTPAQIKLDVQAAIQLAILNAGASSGEATAALGSARDYVSRMSAWRTDGVSAAFQQVASNIASGSLFTGAGSKSTNGNGNGNNNSNGNSAFGTDTGVGGGGGGYTPPA